MVQESEQHKMSSYLSLGMAVIAVLLSVYLSIFNSAFSLSSCLLLILAILVFEYQLKHRHILIYLLMVGMITFFSEFAKLNIKIGNVPVYITELTIFITLISILLYMLTQRKYGIYKYPVSLEFILLYFIAAISFFRGIITYEDKVYVLRQSAMFYYSIFYFIIPVVFDSLEKIENMFKTFFMIYLVIPLINISGLLWHNLGFFAYFYCFIAIIFEILYFQFIPSIKEKHKMLFIFTIVIQLISFILAEARAAWIGGGLSVLFICYLLINNYLHIRYNIIVALKVISIIVLTMFILLVMVEPKIVNSLFNEAMSSLLISPGRNDVLANASINNARWRIYVWKDIINETLEKPVLGWGFGKKFIPPTIKAMGWGGSWAEPDKGFQDPHNSFLSVFHSTGVLGIFIFLVLIIRFISGTLRFIKIVDDQKIKILTIASLASIIYILGTSFFMVVLEGPYLGISLWFLMGIIVSLKMIYKKNKQLNYAE